MSRQHLGFCQPGEIFFDRGRTDTGEGFPFLAPSLPIGWTTNADPQWVHCVPPGSELPHQGWKVHVSATPENCVDVLVTVVHYCGAAGIRFKVLSSTDVLRRRNSKDGDRSASGKFVTIYPAGDAQLERLLVELGGELAGVEGPYILSDLRWRSGPLYVRYGAFISILQTAPDGRVLHCITDPDGNLVEDLRRPVFRPPPWAVLPPFLNEAMQARGEGTLRDFPFDVEKALHFSNGGGVYRARHRPTGTAVVLKEARPLAGLDESGRDAVARQRAELWALKALAGTSVAQEVVAELVGHEHRFFAREFVEGTSLLDLVARGNPLLDRTPVGPADDAAARSAFATRMLTLLERIDTALGAMHARGVVFGDLHPGNILVRDDDTVTFIDLETATPLYEDAQQVFAAPGFRAPFGSRGALADRFALGCVRLSVFLPELTVLLLWDETKLEDVIALAVEEFVLPASFADAVRADLGRWAVPPPRPVLRRSPDAGWPTDVVGSWAQTRRRIATWICDSASPDRTDRLYPGDVGQFGHPAGGLGLSHGAAGVLVALRLAEEEVPDDHVAWLVDATRRSVLVPPGLHDGIAGVGYALEVLGKPDLAREIAHGLRGPQLDALDTSLFSGLAGIGATLLWFFRRTGDRGFLDQALSVADRLASAPPQQGSAHSGLVRGGSGRAVFALALHQATGAASHLELADREVRGDLGRLGLLPGDAAPEVDPLTRPPRRGTLTSAGGIGLAAAALLTRRPADDVAAAVELIADITAGGFTAYPGLLNGRAGTLLVTHALHPRADAPVARALQLLGTGALCGPDCVAFFGDSLLRLSCDLGTGSAGVLAAVDYVVRNAGGPTALPLHLWGVDLADPPGDQLAGATTG